MLVRGDTFDISANALGLQVLEVVLIAYLFSLKKLKNKLSFQSRPKIYNHLRHQVNTSQSVVDLKTIACT